MSKDLGFKPNKDSSFYFLSYNSEDYEYCGKIARTLNELGVPIWYDLGIEYGEDWEQTITQYINKSKALIVFFTKNILKKDNSYVQREYKIAKFFKKKIYIVFLEDINDNDIPLDKVSWWIQIKELQCEKISNSINLNDIANFLINKLELETISINKEKKIDKKLYTINDEKVIFGSYPQSLVSDDNLINQLNVLAGNLPTQDDFYNWLDYKYYQFDEIKSYMFYIDLVYKGNKYRGVYFNSFRHNRIEKLIINKKQDNLDTFECHQADNKYYPNTIYWFKYEPIEWNVVFDFDESNSVTEGLFVSSSRILDSQHFSLAKDDKEIKGTEHPNNYFYSDIRKWLNNNFYNTAFTDEEKTTIELLDVYDEEDRNYIKKCDEEMVSLPTVEFYAKNTNLKPTDYALCQGFSYSYWTADRPKKPGIMAPIPFDVAIANRTDIGVVPTILLKK